MRLKNILIVICVVTVAYFLFDTLALPSTNSLPGNFQETAAYRNPNNTGPVIRMYAVSVEDTLWSEMQQYGAMMPYTKYGTTTVFFFKSGNSPDRISPEAPNFPDSYQNSYLGVYRKDAMGTVSFQKER